WRGEGTRVRPARRSVSRVTPIARAPPVRKIPRRWPLRTRGKEEDGAFRTRFLSWRAKGSKDRMTAPSPPASRWGLPRRPHFACELCVSAATLYASSHVERETQSLERGQPDRGRRLARRL